MKKKQMNNYHSKLSKHHSLVLYCLLMDRTFT